MTDDKSLTFSQAQGLESLPTPLALGAITKEFRALLWQGLHKLLEDSTDEYNNVQSPFLIILQTWHVRYLHLPVDEFPNYRPEVTKILKDWVWKQPYNKLFDLIQIIARHPACPARFTMFVTALFSHCRLAYTVVDDGMTIVPAVTEQEGKTVKQAFEDLATSHLKGATLHLRKSADALNKGSYADSVRESIHAVESVARKLDPKGAQTLRPALDELSKHIKLHTAFKKGLESLYGYTSDEGGIRHALLEDSAAQVDVNDATFMLGACSSFISYLIGKARSAGLKLAEDKARKP